VLKKKNGKKINQIIVRPNDAGDGKILLVISHFIPLMNL
jgi:hypothetical protein